MAEHDTVDVGEPCHQRAGQPAHHWAPADDASEDGGRLGHPPPQPVRHANAHTADGHDGFGGQDESGLPVVIALYRDDRGDLPQPIEHGHRCDIARVHDHVSAHQGVRNAAGQHGECVADVRIGDDADPVRPPHLPGHLRDRYKPIAW